MTTDPLALALQETVQRAVERAVAPLHDQIAALRADLAARPAEPAAGAGEFLSTTAAAELLGVRRETIVGWLRAGLLTPHGRLNAVRVSRRELLALRPDATGAEVVDLDARAQAILERGRTKSAGRK